MPLKHLTETVLVFVLGLVLVLTGVLLAAIPALPQGILPWMIVLVLVLAYPFSLYPLLKRNRADYAFRVLHFVPAILAILWLLLELATLSVPSVRSALHVFTFGWTLGGVAIGFILLAVFCLHVIRRRLPRLFLLALLFVPFVAFGIGSERWKAPQHLTAFLWQGDWWNITGTERTGTESGRHIPLILTGSVRSSSPIVFREGSSSSRPKHLPSAGPETDIAFVASLLALYSGVLHHRAMKRAR
jgi:hypothetical protein